MIREEFNQKYKDNIPEKYYGLSFDIPEITTLLDSYFSKHRIFLLFQIKMKYGQCRIYTSGLPEEEIYNLENQVNEIYNRYNEKK